MSNTPWPRCTMWSSIGSTIAAGSQVMHPVRWVGAGCAPNGVCCRRGVAEVVETKRKGNTFWQRRGIMERLFSHHYSAHTHHRDGSSTEVATHSTYSMMLSLTLAQARALAAPSNLLSFEMEKKKKYNRRHSSPSSSL